MNLTQHFYETLCKPSKSTRSNYYRSAKTRIFPKNQQHISTLLNEVDGLRKDMRKKVNQLKESVTFEGITYPVQSGLWRSPKDLIDVIWYTIKIDDALLWIQFDVYLTPTDWKIHFWNRKGSRKQVEQWLQSQEIDVVETNTGNFWRLVYNGTDNIKPYEAELEDVRKWTLNMFDRLTAITTDRSTDANTSFTNLIPGSIEPPHSLTQQTVQPQQLASPVTP